MNVLDSRCHAEAVLCGPLLERGSDGKRIHVIIASFYRRLHVVGKDNLSTTFADFDVPIERTFQIEQLFLQAYTH